MPAASSKTVEVPTVTYTLYAGRKVGLPGYSNKEASLHAQVTVPADTTLEDVEAQIDATYRFIESKVASRLGLTWSVSDDGKVVVIEDIATAAPSQPARKQSTSTTSTSGGSKDDLWRDLMDNPDGWYDNRENKKNPNGPDFKKKDGGQGLWLEYKGKSQVPEWFSLEPAEVF